VVAAPELLAAAERATFPTSQRIRAIVRPADTAEVQAVVRIAGEHGVPLYPISRGSNWGYGSRVPVTTDSIVIDLSRMDRIVEFDETLGYIVVEPGVSFRQAFAFLRAQRSRLLLSAIGGSPDSSLIGNVVERGIGKGPHGDRFAHVCDLEVVTGDGARLRTGLGRFAGARAAPVHRWGLGPSLDGMFTQSPLGVVTRMSQWLMPRPEHFAILFYRLATEDMLPAVIDVLQALMLRGVLRPTLTLYNDYRVLSVTGPYPFARAGGRTPLPDQLRAELCRERDVGAWGGDIAIYSPSAEHGRATRTLVERALAGKVSQLEGIEADGAQIDGWFAGWPGAAAAPVEASGPETLRRGMLLNFLGIPDDDAIRSVYWRKPGPPPATLDPDRDRCGLLWCTPTAPFTGADVRAVLAIMAPCMRRYGFEPGLTIQAISERVVYVVGSISYDRDAPGDDERALACYHEMTATLAAAGYPPYRASIAGMGAAGDDGLTPVDDSVRVLQALRQALDPRGILAPGRYRV
jgi:4-cresol dehydrogenase (hydroxylating)